MLLCVAPDRGSSTYLFLHPEVIEEISGDLSSEGNGPSNEMCATSVEYMRKFDTSALFKPSVRTRYDLSLKLYSSLLGDCIRKGDDKGFEVAETAASLQRVDVNGPEVFGIGELS